MFPNFSNVSKYILTEIENRKKNPLSISQLNAWIRISSGVGDGLVLYSNPNWNLFSAAGDNAGASIYGSKSSSGTIGVDWEGSAIKISDETQFGYPKPSITSIEIDEGSGNGISRKASFTITTYTEAQLNEICAYFLEPGFTVFIEWGWNTPQSLNNYSAKLNIPYVTTAQSYKDIRERREATKGQYDCFLGFITGGSIGLSENKWDIQINLTGFTELPAYLNVTDNISKENEGSTYALQFTDISSTDDLGKRRFKTMFNELPSIRRVPKVYNLVNDTTIADVKNFINFDEFIKDKINSFTGGWYLFGIIDRDVSGTENGQNVDIEIPNGTKIVGDEKFIKFGTLIKIISQFGIEYKIGNKIVSMSIDTENTPIGGFKNIFSTDKSRLFIPNKNTPKFSVFKAAEKGNITQTLVSTDKVFDNSIKYGDTDSVKFPSDKSIQNGLVDGISINYTDDDVKGLNIDADNWGFLNDLYVNLDFVNGILDTPNFSLIDALYEILNGMSSAVNGFWNFQIQEVPMDKDGTHMILKVVDMNLSPKIASENDVSDIVTFDVYGFKSIFTEASFDMDIGGAMMNQVIGKRLSATVNESKPTTSGKLFSNKTDKVLNEINFINTDTQIPLNESTETDEDIQRRNIELFFEKVGIYPKVNYKKNDTKGLSISTIFNGAAYIATLDDREVFNSIKSENDKALESDTDKSNNTSILFPIKFTFSMHGISGFKRGDRFSIKGIPRQYSIENGFFQVLSIKHTLDGMMWKTTIEGGFRQFR